MSAEKTIGETGEHELIELLSPYVQRGRSGHWSVGVGDDAAVSSSKGTGKKQVITTDLLIEGTHFLRNADTPWFWLGRKAATANLSDIAAMGAWPTGMVVSVGLPPEMRVGDLLEMYRGLHYMSMQEFGAPIIGGDTTRSGALVISITCFGEKDFSQADCLRSDALPGDYVYVTNTLGASRMGLDLVLDEELLRKMMDYDRCVERGHSPLSIPLHLHFGSRPHCETGYLLSRTFSRIAMLDISDGLYNEAHLLAEVSKVQVEIQVDRIPVNAWAQSLCKTLELDAAQYALFSGEEYKLLFACAAAPDEVERVLQTDASAWRATCVGRVNAGRGVRFLRGDVEFTPQNETFRHF